jgi:hypothetical protein
MAPALSALSTVSGERVSTPVTIATDLRCEKGHTRKTAMKF